MNGPSSRTRTVLARHALLIRQARQARRQASGHVQEVQLLDMVGDPPQLLRQQLEQRVPEAGTVSIASRKRSRGTTSVSLGSSAVAEADRGAPSSSASSPKKSPGRSVARIASSPASDGSEIFTRPDATTYTASPGSPWWKITSPRRNRRMRAERAIASRSASGARRGTAARRQGGTRSGAGSPATRRSGLTTRARRSRRPDGGGRARDTRHPRVARRRAVTGYVMDSTGSFELVAARTLIRAATVRASAVSATAAGPGSRWATAGTPTSPPWRTVTSSGTLPRNSRPCFCGEALAAAAAEDLGRLAAMRADERAHVLDEPMTGTFIRLNIASALLDVGRAATSWGVVTRTVPLMGTAWASVSCASEVPGGRSMTR